MKTYGTLSYTNGDEYEGEIENDTPNGQGKITWSNGDTYEGAWKNGFLHGKGRYTWEDGHYYQGEFKEGLKHGLGTLLTWDTFFSYPGFDDFDSASHIEYEGEWKNDKKHGLFKITFHTGNLVCTEEYRDDIKVNPEKESGNHSK